MNYGLEITAGAESDLAGIIAFIAEQDGAGQAAVILDRIEARLFSLTEMSERGNRVPELRRLADKVYREVHEFPWRIIYLVSDDVVNVVAILDSRRNILDLLAQRLSRP